MRTIDELRLRYGDPVRKKDFTPLYYNNMTYIIAGKLNNRTFLMVDCITTHTDNDVTTYKFRNKLQKMVCVDNTFYTITGDRDLSESVYCYDNWLSGNTNERNDLFIQDGDNYSIQRIWDLYKKILSKILESYPNQPIEPIQKRQRIYFINSNNVIIYDLWYDLDTDTLTVNQIFIPNNNKIGPTLNDITYQNFVDNPNESLRELRISDDSDLYEYCKNQITLNARVNNFRDRFSFLKFEINGNVINTTVIFPFRNLDDVVSNYIGADYNSI